MLDNDDALACDYCLNWFHLDCTELDKNLYELLKNASSGIFWYCEICQPKIASFNEKKCVDGTARLEFLSCLKDVVFIVPKIVYFTTYTGRR